MVNKHMHTILVYQFWKYQARVLHMSYIYKLFIVCKTPKYLQNTPQTYCTNRQNIQLLLSCYYMHEFKAFSFFTQSPIITVSWEQN